MYALGVPKWRGWDNEELLPTCDEVRADGPLAMDSPLASGTSIRIADFGFIRISRTVFVRTYIVVRLETQRRNMK
jgi:hypothetical protein